MQRSLGLLCGVVQGPSTLLAAPKVTAAYTLPPPTTSSLGHPTTVVQFV